MLNQRVSNFVLFFLEIVKHMAFLVQNFNDFAILPPLSSIWVEVHLIVWEEMLIFCHLCSLLLGYETFVSFIKYIYML